MRITARATYYPVHSFTPAGRPSLVACGPNAPIADTFERGASTASMIGASRAQRDAEKLALPENVLAGQEKFNEKRALHNQKLEEGISKVDGEIAKLDSDPKLSAAARQKKIDALMKKRAKLQEGIKPPVDMQRVTREVDAIMNDPSRSDADKKQAIEEVRKKWGLPKHSGAVSMRSVTQHLSKVEKQHAKRMRDAQGAAQKEAAQAAKTFGANSPAHLAAKARAEALKTEADQSGHQAKLLGSLYPKPKGFWGKLKGAFGKIGGAFKKIGKGIWNGVKKVGGFVGKIAKFAMPLVKMIPGVGQIAGAAYAGIQGLGKLVRGDWRGALGSISGAIPGGGIVRKVAGFFGL